MTHPTRYWTPILHHPSDDNPRLDYARWLDGCGNPLGEFIRVQCDLARRPRLEFERREQELLAEHQAEWSRALYGRVQWCSFRRGFVEEIALTDAQLLRNAGELVNYAPVLDLHVQWTGMRLDKLPKLAGLKHTLFLDISSQKIGNGPASSLMYAPLLTQVHGLNLSSNCLDDDGLDHLHDSHYVGRLRELYLTDNPITDEGLRRFVMSPLVEQLDVLDVRFTRVSSEGIEVLRHILAEKVLY